MHCFMSKNCLVCSSVKLGWLEESHALFLCVDWI